VVCRAERVRRAVAPSGPSWPGGLRYGRHRAGWAGAGRWSFAPSGPSWPGGLPSGRP